MLRNAFNYSHHINTGVNVGYIDRLVRYGLGIALIASVFFIDLIPRELALTLPLLAVYPITSAVIAWDPLYALFGVTTVNDSKPEKELERFIRQSQHYLTQHPPHLKHRIARNDERYSSGSSGERAA